MNEFEIIFADPLTTAGYMYGSAICVAILLAWCALFLRRPQFANNSGRLITDPSQPIQRDAAKLAIVR